MPEAGEHRDELGVVTGPEYGTSAPVSTFGVASAILAVIAVAAAALVAVMWSGHRSAESERSHQARAMQAAAQWTGILINMNADNVEDSMGRLRDATVGELNAGFDGSIAPYRDVVKTLRSRTNGQVESVSIEVGHNDLDRQPGQRPPAPATLPPELADRTDTVLVVATSVSENAGTKAQPAAPGAPTGPVTVRWNLRLGVSDVDGQLKISRLESLR
jgi:hypothetical protein